MSIFERALTFINNYLAGLQSLISFLGHHLFTFIVIIGASIFAVSTIYLDRRKQAENKKKQRASKNIITSHDIRAIAGEDMMATQLDLARAYIEVGKLHLAQQILDHVSRHGTLTQHQEAEQLLNTLAVKLSD